MADPTTTNILLSIPTRGSDPGTWDTPVNGDFSAIDGYFGGVQTLTPAGGSLTLTAPAGTVTPSGGPTQAQNSVLKFTGSPASNVTVTLPLPGYYIIDNQISNTNGALLTFRAATLGQIIAIDKGVPQHIYNDGTNVRFVNLGGIVGEVTIWGGRSSLPAWVSACSVSPYLLCDGTVYNASQYPYLFGILGGQFGGNGSTTFAVPDLRGRVPLPFDGTGTRITSGGSNINGQVIGAAGGDQNISAHSHGVAITSGGMNQNTTHAHNYTVVSGTEQKPASGGNPAYINTTTGTTSSANIDHTHNIVGSTQTAGSGNSGNVQPSQVTGIAVIRAA